MSVQVMRKSCDVTDVIKTFRKHTEACPIDLMNFDWNQSAIPAGISGFTECFDDVCDVTRFPHCISQVPFDLASLSSLRIISSELL